MTGNPRTGSLAGLTADSFQLNVTYTGDAPCTYTAATRSGRMAGGCPAPTSNSVEAVTYTSGVLAVQTAVDVYAQGSPSGVDDASACAPVVSGATTLCLNLDGSASPEAFFAGQVAAVRAGASAGHASGVQAVVAALQALGSFCGALDSAEEGAFTCTASV